MKHEDSLTKALERRHYASIHVKLHVRRETLEGKILEARKTNLDTQGTSLYGSVRKFGYRRQCHANIVIACVIFFIICTKRDGLKPVLYLLTFL
jgi:hypothetical protein